MTVNQIRSEVEAKLDLHTGFLKDGPWKQKSKQTVLDEHVIFIPSILACTYIAANMDGRQNF